MRVLLALAVLVSACTPLPVPHPERWQPDYNVTDYPTAAARDAGAD